MGLAGAAPVWPSQAWRQIRRPSQSWLWSPPRQYAAAADILGVVPCLLLPSNGRTARGLVLIPNRRPSPSIPKKIRGRIKIPVHPAAPFVPTTRAAGGIAREEERGKGKGARGQPWATRRRC
jgi:hypothetical protein